MDINFSEIVSTVSGWIWGAPVIIFMMATGLYFSFRTRFLQARYLPEMWRMLFQGRSSASGISSFQSFALALSGRVGTGNIAGVATAIALGGPGAVFWMWVIAFVGAGTAYAEASLGQIYKEKIDGHYRGGPAYYISRGLGSRRFAVAFAVVTIASLGVLLPGVQSNAICDAFHNSFGADERLTAALVAALLAAVIFGGVKRLARVSGYVTPFMAVGYVAVAAVILVINRAELPGMFALIFRSAFGMEPALGGMLGAAISMGVKRGVFSNEAGQGTAPHAAAACEVPHPAKQGLVQAFSVYVDTLLVCSATALMILSTGMYSVRDAAGEVIFRGGGLPEEVTSYGPVYTQLAVDASLPGIGSAFVAVALFFFAFTTIMSYYFQAESNVYFLVRHRGRATRAINILRVAVLVVTYFAAINAMTLAWDMADIGVGLMAWFNLVALVLLRKTVCTTFADFEAQLAAGVKEPTFHPGRLGIRDADEWE
ncbi:MAG: alanine:cation symporter family protein [Odoribacteraceae bacterium]|jgi:AGCS family alanine or glycine:cation symporter|nr:alanine:cation symporter family protein [Odoribacteraceae bacterium]